MSRSLNARPKNGTLNTTVQRAVTPTVDRLGRRAEGARLLDELLADQRCTQGVEALAKLTVPGLRQ
jgi:hypothetical protein